MATIHHQWEAIDGRPLLLMVLVPKQTLCYTVCYSHQWPAVQTIGFASVIKWHLSMAHKRVSYGHPWPAIGGRPLPSIALLLEWTLRYMVRYCCHWPLNYCRWQVKLLVTCEFGCIFLWFGTGVKLLVTHRWWVKLLLPSKFFKIDWI